MRKAPDKKRKQSALSKVISIIFTFVLVMIGWVFFRANSISDAFKAFDKMIDEHGRLYNGAGMPTILLSLMLIGILMLVELYRERKDSLPMQETIYRTSLVRDVLYTVVLVVTILLCGSFTGGQFIYFQF